MIPVKENPPASEDRSGRIDGKRQRSAQESALLRWLETKVPQPSAAATPEVSLIRSRASSRAALGSEKVTTLRKALLAEGLDIVPDPLKRYPCPKVERAKGLLG